MVLHSAKYLALQPSRNGQMSPSACHPEQFPIEETDTANYFTTSAALGKDFKTSPESYFFFLLRSWSNPGLKLWSFSYSVFLKWVKIGENCLPVLLSAFFFKLSAALVVLCCAGIKLLLKVKLLFRVDTCTRRFIL